MAMTPRIIRVALLTILILGLVFLPLLSAPAESEKKQAPPAISKAEWEADAESFLPSPQSLRDSSPNKKDAGGQTKERFFQPQPILALASSPDGKNVAIAGENGGVQLLSGARDGFMRLWDAESGKQLRQFQTTPKGWTNCLAWMPDNRRAICNGGGSVVQLWNIESGELVRTFTGHKYGVTGVDVSPDGRSILSCGYDYSVRWWDAATGQQHKLFREKGYVWDVKFSPDGRLAISGSGGRSVGGGKYDSGGNDFPIHVWPLTDEPSTRTRK